MKKFMNKVFEPFFTTKPTGQGSGLGLSMIQGFMKQSGGTVRIYSEPGTGTTFKLYFRAATQKEDSAPKNGRNKAVPRPGSARILVAEDEKGVMDILVRTLEGIGHQVVQAETGDAAIKAFGTSGPIDLLLTDIVMPGRVQGPELAKRLREIQPSLPAIFISGYANEATVHGNGLRPEDIRLMKPVAKADMILAIEKALAVGAIAGGRSQSSDGGSVE